MRVVLISLAVLAVVAGAIGSHPRAQISVPAIGVKVVEANSWSGGTAYLPSVEGSRNDFNSTSSGDGGYSVNASYQVISSSPNHLFVLAHYKITRDGQTTEVDKTLPVLPYQASAPSQEKLNQDRWSKLDNHLRAFAYQSDTAIYN